MAKKDEKPHWRAFYKELALLYDYLLSDEHGCASILYKSKDRCLLSEYSINKRYRAVLNIRDHDSAIKKDLERIAKLFYIAVAIDDKDFDENNKPKLPVYVPRFLDNESDLFKIQIHENKAHSSENLKKTDSVMIAACPRGSLDLQCSDGRTSRQALESAVSVLENEGYAVEIEDTPKKPYFTLSVDAKTICEKHQCDSIQRRFFTGRQIRANFFTQKDDIVQKSKLATVGIVLLTDKIEVVHSHDRSIRTDAKYTKQHVDEVVLESIPAELRSGRLYKRYDDKKA